MALAWHAIAAGVAGSSAAGEFPKLPKRYAPLAGGEVPARELLPGLPLPSQRAVWLVACAAAIAFWQAAAGDRRIGKDFRAICAGNADDDAVARAAVIGTESVMGIKTHRVRKHELLAMQLV